MNIALSVGHSILKNGTITSANGIINEYKYCKEIAPIIKRYLEQLGHCVELIICPEKTFTTSSEEKSYKLNIINNKSKKFDLVTELHLNAFHTPDANGTEVYYYSNAGKVFADRIQKKMITKFRDRKVQLKPNLYILNSTTPPAILLELFFCTHTNDVEMGKDIDTIARLIAEGIAGKNLVTNDNINSPITTNSKESDIKWLQKKLNIALKGIYSVKVTGVFDSTTRIAVLLYWELKGWGRHLRDDGTKIGKNTLDALNMY